MVTILPDFETCSSFVNCWSWSPRSNGSHIFHTVNLCTSSPPKKGGFPLSPHSYLSLCQWNWSQKGNTIYGLSSTQNPLVVFSNPFLLIKYWVNSLPEHHRSISIKICWSRINPHATASLVFLHWSQPSAQIQWNTNAHTNCRLLPNNKQIV